MMLGFWNCHFYKRTPSLLVSVLWTIHRVYYLTWRKGIRLFILSKCTKICVDYQKKICPRFTFVNYIKNAVVPAPLGVITSIVVEITNYNRFVYFYLL